MFEIYCHVHSNTSMGMLSHLSSYTYRLILNDLIIHKIWKNMFKRNISKRYKVKHVFLTKSFPLKTCLNSHHTVIIFHLWFPHMLHDLNFVYLSHCMPVIQTSLQFWLTLLPPFYLYTFPLPLYYLLLSLILSNSHPS